MLRKSTGFTLIELLIVVAIIAILAAIAVPNFLEAQVRSKVSRAKADMRSIATAIESYQIDNNRYPPDALFYGPGNMGRWPGGGYMSQDEVNNCLTLKVLTTPVSYITSIPDNPWKNRAYGNYFMGKPAEKWYVYWGANWKQNMMDYQPEVFRDKGQIWSISTMGPDQIDNLGSYLIFGVEVMQNQTFAGLWGALYDPTNGTTSAGDVVRVGP